MTTSRRRTKLPPDGSWVIDNDVSSSDANDSDFQNEDPQSLGTPDNAIASPGKAAATSLNGNTNASPRGRLQTPRSARRSPVKIDEPEFVMPSMSESSPSSWLPPRPERDTPTKLRKRREVQRNDRAPASKASSSKHARSQADNVESDWQTFGLLSTEVILPLLRYISSTLAMILRFLKPFLAYGLGLWILAYVASMVITNTISRTLAPICNIPGVGWLDLPFCTVAHGHGPVEFEQLVTVQSAFEDVLASTSSGGVLPVEMKKSESSIRDLKHVVQFSALPSRHELVFEISGFIETAKMASSDLTKFNSRIGRAVDHVLSTNHWTLQVLDGVAEREAGRGSINRFMQGTVLAPFRSAKATEDLLLEQYLRHTREIEDQIQQLIAEAQALLVILENLDGRLDVIQGITMRDGVKVGSSKAELLAQLWTKLGGNRSSRKKHDEQLHLLSQVGVYRKTAWDHVSATIIKLQSIAAGLEDLRERVAAPDVLRGHNDVPLRMHIEHIQMGVQRLEDQRLESRKAEGDHHRKLLDRGEAPEDKGRFIEGGK